jgi:hypothetical protein
VRPEGVHRKRSTFSLAHNLSFFSPWTNYESVVIGAKGKKTTI